MSISVFSVARSLVFKKRVPFFVNLIGLSISLAIFFLALLFVQDETSYDSWIPNAERIYRYETLYDFVGRQSHHSVASPIPARAALIDAFSEIEAVSQIIRLEKSFRLAKTPTSGTQLALNAFETLWFADADFLNVIDLTLVAGSKTALSQPKSIILSQSMAIKYFGTDQAVGNTLSEASGKDFVVVAVFEDIPNNSHFEFDFITLYDPKDESFGPGYSSSWRWSSGYTYLKLREGVDPQALEENFPTFIDKYAASVLHDRDTDKKASDQIHPYLNPITSLHLDTKGRFNIKPGGSLRTVQAVSLIALLTLIIACINYVNIATASANLRAKEVAIKKVLGASRRKLMVQFLAESLLTVSVAVVLAIALTEIALPAFNMLTDKQISLAQSATFSNLLLLGTMMFALALVSGFYPAIILSGFRPSQTLGSGFYQSLSGNGTFRTLMVSIQFSVSLVLIIVAIIIAAQQSYLLSKDLGYTSSDKLIVRNMSSEFANLSSTVIATEIGKIPGVEATAYSQVVPSDPLDQYFHVKATGANGVQQLSFTPVGIDYGFFDLYDVPLVAGRTFSPAFGKDEVIAVTDGQPVLWSVIINESIVRGLGYANSSDAIGSIIPFGRARKLEVVGVVADFHMRSLTDGVYSYIFYVDKRKYANLTVTLKEGSDPARIRAAISTVWAQFVPDYPPTIDSLQELLKAQYRSSHQLLAIVSIIALCALFIACLGQYGVSLFYVASRKHEVAIRIVHGAWPAAITRLFLWRFSKPILIALVPAWVAALYISSQYLASFSYRIDISYPPFIGAAALIIVLSGTTVMIQILKVARLKPASVLNVR